MKNIKEILNQPHSNVRAKNDALRNIVQMLKDGEYYKHAQDEKDTPMIKQYHYIAINIKGIKSFAVIRELITGKCHLYSIVEKLRQKNDN